MQSKLGRMFFVVILMSSMYVSLEFFPLQTDIYAEGKSDINVIVGTTKVTEGTNENDVIIGCSYLLPECLSGVTILAKDGSDVIQGSSADDNLYGDEGKDEITGADGNDELYGGPNNDVIQAGFGGDFLVGGPGNDELYAGAGDDVLIGGRGADYFDCGDGQDTIVDFNPAKGDTQAGNCEVVLSETGDIEFTVQYGLNKFKSQSLGVGSFKDPSNINELGESIN